MTPIIPRLLNEIPVYVYILCLGDFVGIVESPLGIPITPRCAFSVGHDAIRVDEVPCASSPSPRRSPDLC